MGACRVQTSPKRSWAGWAQCELQSTCPSLGDAPTWSQLVLPREAPKPQSQAFLKKPSTCGYISTISGFKCWRWFATLKPPQRQTVLWGACSTPERKRWEQTVILSPHEWRMSNFTSTILPRSEVRQETHPSSPHRHPRE